MLRLGCGGYPGRNPWTKQSVEKFSQDETLAGRLIKWQASIQALLFPTAATRPGPPLLPKLEPRMNPDQTLNAWRAAFPHAGPTGFLCRQATPQRWVRIHSLPEAKRYADSDKERMEVLRRYNEAAQELLGQDSNCVLFTTQFSEKCLWEPDEQGPLDQLALTHVMTDGEEDDAMQFFAADVTWRSGDFDLLLSTVADDKTGPVLIFNPARQTAFAPYDGGADLFFRSAEDADRTRPMFQSWLSDRPDGL